MAATDANLVVRQYKRLSCRLQAEVAPADEARAALRLARGVVTSTGWLRATVFDFGSGGIGIRSEVFLPQGSVLRAKVFDHAGALLLDTRVRAQRIQMVGPQTQFEIGTAFVDPPSSLQESLDRLFRYIESLPAPSDDDARGERVA